VKKIFLLSIVTVILSSCAPEVGSMAYIHSEKNGTVVGQIVGYNGNVMVAKLCDNSLISGSSYYFISAPNETCPPKP